MVDSKHNLSDITINMTAQNLDSSERAVMVAATTDFYYCLYCPALTLYACPAVRRNFRLLQVGLHWFILELATNICEVFTTTGKAPTRALSWLVAAIYYRVHI